MFIDRAKIFVRAGDGGDGAVSFRREKYVPDGGPDGGDGGKGGDIIFLARSGINTLQAFRYKRKFAAENGKSGSRRKQFGKSGSDLVIDVPVGTLIKDVEEDKILADLTEEGQQLVIAHGGRGGKGNARFANSVRQAPHFARAGEPGEQLELQIELKLLADVGLVGFPNAGKSTLLSVVSAARPKIADYPFTTIEPGLGVVTVDDKSFVMADIPGLIEGAHSGAGLGLEFLRHIERTRLLVHVLDADPDTGRSLLARFAQINQELALYDEKLAQRPQIVAINKIDLAEEAELARAKEELEEQGLAVFLICAPIQEGVAELLQAVAAALDKLEPVVLFDKEKEEAVYRFKQEELFTIVKEADVYRVQGDWITRLVRSTNFDKHESFQYFQRLIRRKGIITALEEAGIQEGDLVALHDFEFEFFY